MTKILFQKHILWVGEEIMISRRNDDQKMTVRESGDQGDLTGMFGFLAAAEQANLIT